MRGLVLGFALLVGCGAPKTANEAIKVSLPNRHYFLANGLEVVLEPDHHSPYVAVRMRYHVGSKDDPAGRSGLAHLAEHMTFACGEHVGKDAVIPAYNRLGAIELNGVTHLDDTDYFAVIPSAQLENALWLEAERMAFVVPALDAATYQREQGVVRSERSEHYGNKAYGWLHPLVQGALFPHDHPYHHSGIGSSLELDHASLDDVASFLRKNYVPDNATLVLVGDVDSGRASALIEKYFGSIPPGPKHEAPRQVTTPAGPARAVVHAEANVPYPLLAVAWMGPPPSAPSYPDATMALSYISGSFDYRTTHLSKLVAEVWWEAWGGRLGSILSLVIKGERGTTFVQLQDEAKRALWATTTRSTGWWDVSSPRSRAISRIILGLEDLADRGEQTANGLVWYGTADYAQPQIDNLLGVTASSVQDAAETILTSDRAAYVWIEPNSGAPASGRVID